MKCAMYIPLDERPCNYIFPQMIAQESGDMELLVPPKDILGWKKQAADVDALWDWINEHAGECSFMIASIDMLLYGGIVPSRVHHLNLDECKKRINRLNKLKNNYPSMTLYAFNLIMRMPSYNSDDEEPDYYAEYGEKIYKYSWIWDRVQCNKATPEETSTLDVLKAEIPSNVLEDYINRRVTNSYINQLVIELVKEGTVDFLAIPLDDCSEFGFSAAEQRFLIKLVEKFDLQERVYLYPGADEVGCTLTARAINSVRAKIPRVFVRYSSTIGPSIIPMCEDRALGESVKYQIITAGGVPVDNSNESDFILMVNSPTIGALDMGDMLLNTHKDRSYYSMRNLREFVLAMQYYISTGKKCALADVAFINGADDELMRMVSRKNLLQGLISYAGWNTSSNTLGTVISHSMVRCFLPSTHNNTSLFYIDRLVEDWGYQCLVRKRLISETGKLNISYFDLGDNSETVSSIAFTYLYEFICENLSMFINIYHLESVCFPWNRLFEIKLQSGLEKDKQ